jgi:hypothetical protein
MTRDDDETSIRYVHRRPHGCAGRHGHRRGFGTFFDGAFDRGDVRWHGFRSGRKLGGDDLQLLILALLAEKPAHGYEIIKALSERSGGFYSPSPGMVYPALTYLEEIDYASVEEARVQSIGADAEMPLRGIMMAAFVNRARQKKH